MTREVSEEIAMASAGLAPRGSGRRRRMEGYSQQGGGSRWRQSPEEQAEIDSLQFYLEGYKTSTSSTGRATSLRKIYEIFQSGYYAKRDYFHLPSVAKFWRNYETLHENLQTLDHESIFWFHAIAIHILFKDTKSTDIYLPSYAMTIIEGLIQCLLMDSSAASQSDLDHNTNLTQRPISNLNNFGKKRKYSNKNHLSPSDENEGNGHLTENRNSFAARRKLTGDREIREDIDGSASSVVNSVNIKRGEGNSISSFWFAMGELLHLNVDHSRYCWKDLPFLSSFVINRYLNFLISNDVIRDSQDSSQQLQLILDFLRTSGVLERTQQRAIALIRRCQTQCEPDYRERFFLWNILGLLESACFRNVSNQKFITENPESSDLMFCLISIIKELGLKVISLLYLKKDVESSTSEENPPSSRSDQWEVLGDLHPLHFDSASSTLELPNSIFLSFHEKPMDAASTFDFHSSSRVISPFRNGCADHDSIKNVDIHDLWLSCIKLAINLSHQNISMYSTVMETDNFQHIFRTIDELLNLRDQICDDTFEKFIFDAMLYLLTFLLNIVEAVPQNLILDMYTKFNLTAKTFGSSPSPKNVNGRHMLHYLLTVITKLSASVMSDLEQTDELLTRKLCKKHLKAIGSENIDNSLCTTKYMPSRENDESKKLPVDDIILCSHFILIFRSLLHQLTREENEEADALRRDLQSSLPRCSWWLPKRILLAYLALQDEIDTIRCINVQPVINAIRYFDSNGGPQNESVLTR